MANLEDTRENHAEHGAEKQQWVAPEVIQVSAGSAEGAGALGDDGFDAGTS